MKHVLILRSGTIVALSVVAATASMPAQAAASCYSQGKALKAQQAEAVELKAERDELVMTVEDAGDNWEDIEALRNFSAENAAAADAAKTRYDTLKAELHTLEADLQSKVSTLNEGVAAYNRSCAKKN